MSLANYLAPNLLVRKALQSRRLGAPSCLLLASILTLVAVVADQLAAPILQTTSPLWATAAWLLLVWRRGKSYLLQGDDAFERPVLPRRLAAFAVAHLLITLVARLSTTALQPVAGTATVGGTLLAAAKLFVLAPTLFLLPLSYWKQVMRAYSPEAKAVLVVLFTYMPRRALEALWPWYGQVLGRFVFTMARLFVPGLGYQNDLTPTLTGPDQDITIVFMCSGIGGFELFGYLFGFVALLDWNCLRKGRALFLYAAGSLIILLGNALRIALLVVLANRGFADFVSRFHISAGSIFFSVIFLVYLTLTYKWMLNKRNPTARLEPNL